MINPYTYKAKLRRVVDGDTIDAEIDVGFRLTATLRLRLARIDAWETRGEEREKGLEAKAWLIDRLPDQFMIRTSKAGSFGRWLAEVWVQDGDRWVNVNDELMAAGHALPNGQ